jgi:DNA-directed RNA polymerase subunit RPC12/RpoP
LAFSPDGQTLVSGSVDKTVKLWNRATGAEVRTLTGHTGAVQTLVFAPDAKRFASAGDDKIIHIWDAVSGKDLATLQGHEAPIRALAFASDGVTLASAGADAAIKIWDLVTMTEARSLQGHTGPVCALAFSSDGALASAGEDTTVKLWEASKGSLRFTLEGHTASVLALAFSPKGRTLVSGSQDAIVRVWDPASGQSRGILKQHKDAVTGLAIHPHGHNLVSGSHDTLLLRWQSGASAMDGVRETPSDRKNDNAAPKHFSRIPDNQEAEPKVQITPQPQAPTALRRGWLLSAVLAFGFLASIGIAVSLLVRSARGREARGLLASVPRIWLTSAVVCVFFFAAVGIAGTIFLTQPQGGSSVSHLDKLLGTEPTPGIEEEGFYGTEVSKSGTASRWTNGVAKIIVPLHGATPKAVRVSLAIPSERPVVNIRINGQSVLKERVAKDNFTETFDLAATKLGKELTLEILSDTVVPAEKNKNSTDERTLGVRVLGISLLSEAGFQKADKETFVVFGEGFFGQERNDVHTFRWMGDRLPKEAKVPIEGIVKLRNTRKDMFLKIVGDVPVYAMREPPTLKVTFNGEVLEEFVPAKRELDKLYKVPAGKQSKEKSSELRLTCSTFFIPAEYHKKSTDDRRMCFRVFRLAWADKEEDLNTSEVPVAAAPVTPAAEPPNFGDSNSGLRSWIWLVLLSGMGLAAALVLILAAGLLVANRRAAKMAESSIATNPPKDAVPFIAFTCSECGKKLKTKSGMVGKKVKCSKCGKAVLVPPAKAGQT